MIGLAVGLAVLAAICLNIGMYFNKKAVADLPKIRLRLKASVVKAFLQNTLILKAIGLALVGGAFYAVAMGMAPVSIVQPVVGSGVALLAYLAIKNLGEKPRRIDYLAIGLNILGVALIGFSLIGMDMETKAYDSGLLWIFAGGIILLAVVIPFVIGRGSDNTQAAALGVTVGLLYGIAAVFSRIMLLNWKANWDDWHLLVIFSSIYLLAWLATFLPAVITVQAALQKGMAIVVVPILAGLTQLVPIVVGTVALKEPFPKDPVLFSLRILAFVAILTGTVILSRRAEETIPEPYGEDAAPGEGADTAPGENPA